MKEIYTNCDKCGRDINYGEAYIAYTKTIETAQKTGLDENEIEIADAFQVRTLCINCGGVLYAKEVFEIDNEIEGLKIL